METTAGEVVTKHYSLDVIELVTISVIICVNLYLAITSIVYLTAKEEKDLKTVNRLCCLAGLILLLSVVSPLLETTLDELSSGWCTFILSLVVMTNMGNRFSVYLILWMRQNALYKSVRPRTKWSETAKYVNKSVLLLFGVFASLPILLLVLDKAKFDSHLGCKFEELEPLLVAIFSGYILSHVLLLLLFLLPLSTHYRNLSGAQAASKRLIACTVACVVTDVVFTALVALLHRFLESSPYLSPTLFSCIHIVDHIVLNITLIFSFPNYKQRFWPIPIVLENRRNRVKPTVSLPYMG